MEGITPLTELRAQIQRMVATDLARVMEGEKDVPLQKLQSFRKKEEHRLKLWHRSGGGGKEIAERRTVFVDLLVREIFSFFCRREADSPEIQDLVLSAFGGYGRRELNPFSDVDITFLHRGEAPTPVMEAIITAVLMVLWDLGFKVGHATRSLRGAVRQGNTDMMAKTAMMESRWLAGDRGLFEEFRKEFEASCVKGHEKEYLEFREGNLRELRKRYGSSVFMQEPNVKSGCGGLRDYQNLLWTAMFHCGTTGIKKLTEEKILREGERRRLEESHEFLLRVRTEMHYQTGRSTDQLTLRLQGQVATALGYPEKTMIKRCEAFMRDYYRHAREIHLVTTLALGRIREQESAPRSLLTRLLGSSAETVDEMVIRGGELFPVSRDIFNRDPSRMMRSFRLAQQRNLRFSAELGDLVRRRLRLVDRTFQYGKENREVFLSILSGKGKVGGILRLMHDLGFLGKYLPEFDPLTCLVQHEFFHRYTADEHTLRCIDKIDGLLFATDPKFARYAAKFRHLEDPAILYLAMLLHDTGKAANTKRHEEASALAAQRVARRFQLSPARKRMLITLVSNHGEMSGMARTRNIEDPATVAEFAQIVRDATMLDMLTIITLADGMGTSDEGWSDWKETMIWMLHDQTRRYLAGSEEYHRERRVHRETVERTVLQKLPAGYEEEAAAHLSGMPDRYFATRDEGEITAHIRLFRKFFEQGNQTDGPHLKPVVEWIDSPPTGHTEVRVCGWDRDRLLERIAASFLEAGINVLSADIHTRADQLALDLFRVANSRAEPLPGPRERERFEKRLEELLQAPGHRLVPDPRNRLRRQESPDKEGEEELPFWVVVNNNAHPDCTILEIQAPDRIGLLYHLLRAITHGGIQIEAARIATERKAALDVFYIRSRQGGKITGRDELLRLERRLRTASARAGTA